MKNYILIVMLTPLFFLVSCSSGGSGDGNSGILTPDNANLLHGTWKLHSVDTELYYYDLINGTMDIWADTTISWNQTDLITNGIDLTEFTLNDDWTYNQTIPNAKNGTWDIINNKLSFDDETPNVVTISSSGNYFYHFPNPEDVYIANGINTWVSYVNYEETYRKIGKSTNTHNINSENETNTLKIVKQLMPKR